jgi:hypothetical protein
MTTDHSVNQVTDSVVRAEQTALPGFVFLVQSCEDYERPDIIEAHLDEAAASARVDVLNEYADLAPLGCPEQDAPEQEWDAHWKKEAEWKAAHPLGPEVFGYYNQRYEVCEVPLATAPKVGADNASPTNK